MTLKNIKIINHNSIIENADILIEDKKIVSIIPKTGDHEFIAVPGFIDTHIHGFSGHDAMDGKEAIEIISKNLVKHGTTSFLPTLMTSDIPNIIDKLEQATNAKSIGSEIIGFHLEGPFVSHEKKGAHDSKYIIKAKDEQLKKIIDASKGMLKKITIAPESFSLNQIKILINNNIMPSIGHSNTSSNIVNEYIREGALSITHLWNAMSGVANRNPGVVEAALNNKHVYAELICDLVHVDEEAINLSINSKTPSKIIAVTDAIRPAGLEDGEFTSGGLDIVKKGSLITLKGENTIAGSGATMLDNFRTLIMLGYNIKDVVAMTSTNAAKLLKLNEIGEIKENYFANINILNKNGELEKVINKGEEI